jgi:hypothetical protein
MTATIILLACMIRYFAGGPGTWFIAWPGTAVHELCHWFVGLITLGQPDQINIMPSPPKDGEQVLGSVTFNNIGWWNALPIGIAPLLGLPIALAIAGHYTFDWSWGSALCVWILASVVSQCWPSSTDWRIAFKHPVGVALYGGLLYMIFAR